MIQQFYFWVYTQKNLKQGLDQIFVSNFYNSIIHKSQNVETTQMFLNRCMDKQNVLIHMVEYYSAIKRNEVPIHVRTWMNLENMMLSEMCLTQKDILYASV